MVIFKISHKASNLLSLHRYKRKYKHHYCYVVWYLSYGTKSIQNISKYIS